MPCIVKFISTLLQLSHGKWFVASVFGRHLRGSMDRLWSLRGSFKLGFSDACYLSRQKFLREVRHAIVVLGGETREGESLP